MLDGPQQKRTRDLRLAVLAVGLGLALYVAAAWSVAQEDSPVRGELPGPNAPPTTAKHYSYAIGLDIGSSFRADQIELDMESLLAGVQDGQRDAKPRYSPELCQASMQRLSAVRREVVRQRNQQFLAENRKQDGVQVTPSGLQFQVLKQGDGNSPGPTDVVEVHYHGQLVDGTVFDSTRGNRPVRLPVNRVIAGWSEALQKMKVGDAWRLVVPSELAYGEDGIGDIPPFATLIFEVELLGIAAP